MLDINGLWVVSIVGDMAYDRRKRGGWRKDAEVLVFEEYGWCVED